MEYIDGRLDQFLGKNRIRHEYSPPYEHESNIIADKFNRKIDNCQKLKADKPGRPLMTRPCYGHSLFNIIIYFIPFEYFYVFLDDSLCIFR